MRDGKEAARASRQPLMELSRPGRVGAALPELDVPAHERPPADLTREELPLPELSELDVVRYFTHLSQLNFSVDSNFYPLGSCTMKYNPRVNEEAARLPGLAGLHPLQPAETAQGALQLMWELQEMLAEVTGLEATSLAPLAGAHGELAGVLMVRSRHLARGEEQRRTMLVPDSAHGTNPASAAMAGFRVVAIPSDSRGNLDLKAMEEAAGPELAGLMITQPSTLGLFDTGILDVCNVVHDAGGLVYGDGANMNALLGRVKPGELGLDIVHLNLHKTFSTPHGGGGPGAGPLCVTGELAGHLPGPVASRRETETGPVYDLAMPERSIGRLGGFQGSFGVAARAYAYLRALGEEGLRAVSENAVINANYVLEGLKGHYDLPYDRRCMHEVVFSGRRQEQEKGIRALDVAKRLIDHGIHPPTMYFPLIVEAALMIEPTEVESRETLDHFIDVMREIAREAKEQPELLKGAPHHTPNTRLDEAAAARRPRLRWRA